MVRPLVWAVAWALSAQAAAQTPALPPVRLDVSVVDARGRFVETLRPEDFEVVEDDDRLQIADVRLVTAGGAADAGESFQPIASAADERFQAARDGTRLFAIYLDEYHVTPGDPAARARELVAAFLDQIGPRDLVLVVKPLDSLVRLRMTRDRDAVRRAAASFEGRKGDYQPRSELERSLMAGDATRIDAARAQVSLSALNAIAAHLGGLSATRKTLLVITEGFAGPGRRRSAGALATIDTVIRSANRAIVSIYAVDPRPTPPAPGDAGHQTLGRLTAETDGRAILPAADLQAGLDQLLRDSSRYYLLTLHGVSDGRFHPVAVRVRPRGLQVRARQGFWSASADELNRVRLAARPGSPAPPPLLPRRASPLIRPWFGVAPGPGGKPQVSFVWEPANRVPGDAAAVRPARILLKARTSDGTLIYEGAARPASSTPAAAGETPAQLSFSAPPGRLRVEMAIEDAAARLVDTDVRDVLVDAPKGPLALGTPRVLRSRTAREHRALETDPDAVPTASRQFSRIERLWMRVPVFSADRQVRVSARLTSAIGGAMRELPVAVASSEVEKMYQIDLPLAGLASGDYSVEFLAASGSAEVKEVVSFRVTP